MKTLKKEFMNELRKMKEEVQKLTGKQIGALILYVVCATLVQVGAQMIALKIYDFYTKLVRKIYEKHNLDFDKHSLIHIFIAIIMSALVIYGLSYTAGYLFGKYIFRKAFDEA